MSRFQCFKIPVFQAEEGTCKNGKCQVLKMAGSHYNVILIKL